MARRFIDVVRCEVAEEMLREAVRAVAFEADTRPPRARVRKMGRDWWATVRGGGDELSSLPFPTRQLALRYLEQCDPMIGDLRVCAVEEAQGRLGHAARRVTAVRAQGPAL